MIATLIPYLGGLIAVIIAGAGLWLHGKSVGVKQTTNTLQPKIDAANTATEKIAVDSEVANQQVVDAAKAKSAQVDAIIKEVDSRPNLPEGEAMKELQAGYSKPKDSQ